MKRVIFKKIDFIILFIFGVTILIGCGSSFFQRVEEIQVFQFKYVNRGIESDGKYSLKISFPAAANNCQTIRLSESEIISMLVNKKITLSGNNTLPFNWDMLNVCRHDQASYTSPDIYALNPSIRESSGGSNPSYLNIRFNNHNFQVTGRTPGSLVPGPMNLASAEIAGNIVGGTGQYIVPNTGTTFFEFNFIDKLPTPERYIADFNLFAKQGNRLLIVWEGELILQD